MPRSYFHVHLVSDATGETLISISRAAAAQYEGTAVIEHFYPMVRSRQQIERVTGELAQAPGIVLYTLVDRELAGELEKAC
ncbi:MAG: kinase/pyrophosphorylase, partial [Beijerinckiaceae bacterium]